MERLWSISALAHALDIESSRVYATLRSGAPERKLLISKRPVFPYRLEELADADASWAEKNSVTVRTD